jgi:hypothetical protein
LPHDLTIEEPAAFAVGVNGGRIFLRHSVFKAAMDARGP